MKAAVFLKSHNGQSHVVENKRITLEAPSVVQLPIGPEEVARFERDGNDLILVLGDGTVLVIENFFVVTENGRNDLVFEDQNDVTWWAQYGDNWTGFDIAEINREGIVPLWPVLAGLGLLAGGAGIAIGGGGGDSNAAPDVRPEVETTPEDTPISGNLLKNDTDADGDKLFLTEFTVNGKTYTPADGKVEIPGVGTIIINENGDYTFTPVPDWNGKVPTITYTVSDGEDTKTSTLDIEVTPVQDIVEDTAETHAGKPVTTNVFENDKFDNPDAKITGATNGKHGTVTINKDGTITYTPEKSYVGEDEYTYTVTSGGVTETTTVKVTVTNEKPVAAPEEETTPEDTPLSGNVLANDSDADGDKLTVTEFKIGDKSYQAGEKADIPGVGSIIINKNGNYTFTPVPDWNGKVPTITYAVSDGNDGGTSTSTLDIEVTPVNDAPIAKGAIGNQADMDADTISDLDVTIFFKDVDVGEGDTLTYTASGLPEGLKLDPDTGIISGTIDRSASQDGTGGVHSVTVTATDSGGLSVDQTFTWTVTNPAPVADDDTATTKEDTEVRGNVLINDSDPDGDPLKVTGFKVAGDDTDYAAGNTATIDGVGTIIINEDGSYTFTPADDWNGTVPTITYTISDGEGGEDTADLNITVDPVNDAPVSVGEIEDQTGFDAETITELDVKDFFSDVDGDKLTYSAEGLPEGLEIDPDTGLISGTPDRSASQGGADGVYTVIVTATDPDGEKTTQEFSWTISNPAPTANDDKAVTDEDTAVSGNVLTGTGAGDVADSDPDGDPLKVTGFKVAGDDTDYAAGNTATIDGVGTIIINEDGSYTFTPADDWNGTVPTITYTISDGEGGEDTADLNITINPVNDDPVIAGSDQSGTVIEAGNEDDGTVVDGMPSVTGGFTASDVDGDILTWSVIGTPDTTYGTFTIDPATGEWKYELDNTLDATQALKEGESKELTYTVEVSDGNGGTDTRTVTITINGTNDSPVANADTGAVTESGVVSGGNTPTDGISTATGNVLTNDTDVDADEKATLKVSAVDFGGSEGTVGSALIGTYGLLVLNVDGTYTYTLDNTFDTTQALKQGQTATEVFTYTVVDVNGAISTSTLTITVTGTNDRPEITSTENDAKGELTEQGTTNPDEENTVTGTLTASDVDADASQTWSITGTGNGIYGKITIDPATGKWTYTLDNEREATQKLNDGDVKEETFTARVKDEHGAWSEQVIKITVKGSNDELESLGDEHTVTLTEDGSKSGTLQEYVKDVDDEIIVTKFTVDTGEGEETFTFGEGGNYNGTPIIINDGDGNKLGELTIQLNGDYSFKPAPNYAGNVPDVKYTMAEAGDQSNTIDQTLKFEITKVSDAPDLEANKTLKTPEDTAISLGLKVPVITDTGTGTGNNDYPERIGEITLTIGGAGKGGVTFTTGSKTLTPVNGKITIVLTDEPHIAGVPAENNANGIYYLTKAEYEALQANPLAESGKNFTVTVDVTSYEVDADGNKFVDVNGAANKQVIDVDVQAVTDGATLTLDPAGASLTFAEDGTIDLSDYLSATKKNTDGNTTTDDDGSERYWYTVSGLQPGTVVNINGENYTANAAGEVTSDKSNVFNDSPSVTIKPPKDFSGDMNGIKVTLNSQDTDADSNGTIDTVTSEVTLDLHVTPVAGDVEIGGVETKEDTAVAFLKNVKVTDTGSGSEVITSVSFTVPKDWTHNFATSGAGWTLTESGGTYTITFDDSLTEAARENVLASFEITPPAHSSKNAEFHVSVTTTDTNMVNGVEVTSDPVTVEKDVKITVTPVAERTDTDSDGVGGVDVTMNVDHAYTVNGLEDEWFALGTNYTGTANTTGGFEQLKSAWSNADPDEFTYAVLTPELASDSADDSVIGTVFRYQTGDGNWHEQTFVGEPIWVPVQYLDSLQVKLPPNVSGTLKIGMQAATVDYDDDQEVTEMPLDPPHESGPGVSVDISGGATLTLIEFKPVADDVTMALNGRASGLEDTEIPLFVKTTSSDPSETFNVTIEGIPDGAKILYNGSELTVTNGKVTIVDFDNSAKLSVTPPENSNADFDLKVTAVSVDGESTSAETSRVINVVVTGVADDATVNVAADYVTTEAEVDDAGHTVKLDKVVNSVVSDDAIDGSETVTLRITGLDKDFSIEGAVLLSRGDPNGDGRDRVWSIPADKLDQVHIKVPDNYSGTVKFEVAGVTTEDDGDSKTSSVKEVSFTITPSPEATITTNATLIEDEITKLDLSIVHQNGDDNEVLGDVYIAVDYDTDSYTLYLNGVELSEANLATKTIGGVAYYVIPAGNIADLGALAPEHKDGNFNDLHFKYDIIDPSNDGTVAAVTETKDGTLNIKVTPVTDKVHVSIDGITVGAEGSVADNDPDDKAEPDTVTLTQTGSVTVNFHVTSDDTDGSEHLVRVLIEGVPDGVSVVGASHIGGGSWMLVYEGADAKAIGENGLDVPVEFVVGQGVSHDGVSDITMTAMVRDQGQDAGSPALIEKDSVTWHLELELDVGTVYPDPSIDEWRYNEASGTEDTSFTLKDVMGAAVTTPDTTHEYSYTVSITDLPEGTVVEGMTFTDVNGVPTWTATVVVPEGGNSQAALDDLLNTIKITPPLNSNDNNADFIFDTKLTAAAVGGRSVEKDATADMPVTPVTDEATIEVDAPDVDEGQNSVTVTISAESIIDGTHGTIVEGKLYVQMDVDGAGNAGGTLTDSAGNTLTLEAVTGIEGVPDGNYYVVNVSETGGSVDLTYQAPEDKVLKPGSVKFDAWAQTQENGAANTETSHTSGTAEIKIINNGVTVKSTPVSGNEPAIHNKSAAIELDISVTLNDNDSSEAIKSILLAGVPVGFLVYVGDSAGNAHPAVNGGGDGNNNTWTLSSDGKLPDYIAILPPPHWSGTVDGLSLIVSSGEAGLPALVENLDLASVTVTPTADGLTLDPTLSFGREGDIIALNLNAAMKDPSVAKSTLPDESTETTTLQISGLGEHASFYIGSTLYQNVTYDPANGGTYTITGLSQNDLDKLGFKQAANALTDQDTANSGLQLKVDAWTVESDGSIESDKTGPTSITVDVKPVLTSSRDDDLIWSGEAINGRAGTDTVHLRYGENLTGAQLAAKLKNIEVLDLGIDGANKITDLTAEQVKSIIGSGNTLTIKGTDADSVSLSGNWTDNRDGTYTSGSVTVKVTGNEDDVPSVSGAVEARSSSMMSFGMFDEQDSFGLASLDTHQPAQQTEPDAAPILIDDVLSSDTNSDDLTYILPEEHRDLSTPSSAKSSTQPDFVDMSSPDMLSSLEDEIMRSTHYEV